MLVIEYAIMFALCLPYLYSHIPMNIISRLYQMCIASAFSVHFCRRGSQGGFQRITDAGAWYMPMASPCSSPPCHNLCGALCRSNRIPYKCPKRDSIERDAWRILHKH